MTIKPVSHAETVYDDYTKEPIQMVTRSSNITIHGQFRWYVDQRLQEDSASGISFNASGHIILLKKEAAKQSYIPQVGDLISEIAEEGNTVRTVYLYIAGIDPFAHYKYARAHKLFFEDRQPVSR